MSLNLETDASAPLPDGARRHDLLQFEENLKALCRFNPALADFLSLKDRARALHLLSAIPKEYVISFTGEGLPLLSVNGFFLQSRYNPVREAERALADPASGACGEACIFAGVGLAYFCLERAKRFPDALSVIVEPDINIFLLCMKFRNLKPLFAGGKAIFLIGLSPSDCAAAIEEMQEDLGLELPIFKAPALAKANGEWFESFHEALRRRREKKSINISTLRRFGSLWLKNMTKNRKEIAARPGIARLEGIFAGIPALLLAAGPTLDNALPHLKAMREKCVVIAADTALRACLRSSVQPDFLLLVDPQYLNYRHIAGLSAPASFLVTEPASWPAVFRFSCRGIFLCSSSFPIGKFIEDRTGKKGALGAGGSVATAAWDFARFIGASRVYAAGLDLSYPQGKTHFRGAFFEEAAHAASSRLCTAEQSAALSIFSAGPFKAESSSGGEVLTDRRLSLYAWWLQSALSAREGLSLTLLSDEGLKIPGSSCTSPESLNSLPPCREKIGLLLSKLERSVAAIKKGSALQEAERALQRAEDELCSSLSEILSLAENGKAICKRALKDSGAGAKELRQALTELARIRAAIARHPARGILALPLAESGSAFSAQGGRDAALSFLRSFLSFYEGASEAARANLLALGKSRG